MQYRTVVAILSGFHAVHGSHVEARATGSLETFIASESPIALEGILNNVGPNGSKVEGANSGVVVASPSKENPNCE